MPLHDAPAHRRNNLLLLGVSERAVIDIMGWSSAKMTLVYQHVTDSVRTDVASRVGRIPLEQPATGLPGARRQVGYTDGRGQVPTVRIEQRGRERRRAG